MAARFRRQRGRRRRHLDQLLLAAEAVLHELLLLLLLGEAVSLPLDGLVDHGVAIQLVSGVLERRVGAEVR